VTGAQDRFNRAQSLLATVAAAAALTDAEQSHMLDATIVGAAKGDPATHRQAVGAADLALSEAQTTLDRLQAQAAAGLPHDDIPTAQGDVTDKQNALTAAQGAFTQADQDALDAWAATVPPASWTLLAAFDEADLILHDLESHATAAALSGLETAMTTAADALVTQLGVVAASTAAVATLTRRVALQAELLAAVERTGSVQVLNALRGDG
jgi:hypothetical protein